MCMNDNVPFHFPTCCCSFVGRLMCSNRLSLWHDPQGTDTHTWACAQMDLQLSAIDADVRGSEQLWSGVNVAIVTFLHELVKQMLQCLTHLENDFWKTRVGGAHLGLCTKPTKVLDQTRNIFKIDDHNHGSTCSLGSSEQKIDDMWLLQWQLR